jgi:predicted RNA-binding protein YlqC (UPF0109 family)
MHGDQEFLEHVVKALVDKPEDVKVERVVDEMGVLLTLDVNPEDMGKIIGRSGNTAKAIRTLLRVVGMKNNARVNLKINEPEGGSRPMEREEAPAVEESSEAEETAAISEATKSVDEAMEDLKI